MLNRYLTYYKPSTQFVVFCAILSMSFMVGAYAMELLNPLMLGIDSTTLQSLKEYSDDLIQQLKWAQLVSIFIIFGLPGILFAYLAYPSANRYLGFVKPQRGYHLLWGATLLLIALPFSTLLEQWNAKIPMSPDMVEMNEHYEHLAMAMLRAGSVSDLLFNTLVICIVPALLEELLFRGVIQQIITNWTRSQPFAAILITAFIFSLLHFEMSGFLPRLFLGFILGYAYYVSGSLWVSILMHAINNFLIVGVAYLSQTHQISLSLTELPDMPILIGLASLAVTLGFAYLFYKQRVVFPLLEVDKNDSTS